MSDQSKPLDLARAEVIFRLPGTDAVEVRGDLSYRSSDGEPLALHVYMPSAVALSSPPPAVILVPGYPDPGFRRFFGLGFEGMGSTRSWARLIAAWGMAAITFTNREPAADARALLHHVREHAKELGVDGDRLGLWSSSGNAPLALWLLMEERGMRCAALLYPYTLDVAGATGVSDAARQFGFVNPAAGRTVDDLPAAVPLLVVRAGRDVMPLLNEGVDRFVAAALARNLPIVLLNNAEAPHAFDLTVDDVSTARVVDAVLTFLQQALWVPRDTSTSL